MPMPPIAGVSPGACDFVDFNEETPLLASDHQRFDNVVNEPQHMGFGAWLQSFIHRLLGIFGEKMSPGELTTGLDKIFSEDKGWEHKGSFPIGGTERTAFRVKVCGGETHVVCATAHDLKESGTTAAQLAGGRSVSDTLKELTAAYPTGSLKALIPIAQSNTYGPFGPRGHFTLLEVNITDGAAQKAILHDSKGGFVDWFYGGAERLTEIFRQEGLAQTGPDFSVEVEHRGEQSLLNGKDCGRFASYYADQIAQHGSLQEASREGAEAFFAANFGQGNR